MNCPYGVYRKASGGVHFILVFLIMHTLIKYKVQLSNLSFLKYHTRELLTTGMSCNWIVNMTSLLVQNLFPGWTQWYIHKQVFVESFITLGFEGTSCFDQLPGGVYAWIGPSKEAGHSAAEAVSIIGPVFL